MQIKKNHGFSLFELLLVVVITAGLFASIAVVLNGWAKNSVDQTVSDEMLQLQNAAKEYVRFNITDIITSDIPVVGNVDEINIVDIIADGFLPVGYSATNSYRQNLRVFVRYLADDSINGDVVEVITLSDGNPTDDRRLFNAAQNGNNTLGIISDLNISATCCNGNIQSTSGTWSVDIADFVSLAPPTPNADGGYMAAYDLVSVNNDISNNYLFRSEVPASPELNMMETDLDLNGNNITNAGIIVSESMDLVGNAIFGGIEANGAPSPYVLSVRDNLNVVQDMNIQTGASSSKGTVRIYGENTAASDFTVTNSLDVQYTTVAGVTTGGSISSNTLTANQLTNVGGISRFNNIDANGSNINATEVITNDVGFSNAYQGDNLQILDIGNIGTLQASAASLSAVTVTDPFGLTIPNNVTIFGNATINGNTNVNQVSGRQEVTINDMTACGTGCPGL